jgi:hypothetical protein
MSDTTLIERFGRYQKSAAAAIIGLIGWGYVVIDSAPTAVTASEWLALATVGAVTAGVYGVPNTPVAPVEQIAVPSV